MKNAAPSREDSLHQALRAIGRLRRHLLVASVYPVPCMALAAAGLFMYQAKWYMDPFLSLLYGLFALGQVTAWLQFRRVGAAAVNTGASIELLRAAGDEPDLEALRGELVDRAPPGHLRDLLLRWLDLGLRGETAGAGALLDNALDRRAIQDGKLVAFHVGLNRTTLKMGFLGTLIGLMMTFPPMKTAILGLSSSQGEMKFITDVAHAIDGDQYAIVTTLVATALSILIEFLTIGVLERALGAFEVVNSHVNDWNLTRLQPHIRRAYGPGRRDGERAEALAKAQAELDAKLIASQAQMDRHLSEVAKAMSQTHRQIEQLAALQAAVGKRVAELSDYERQYRGFLRTKAQAASPTDLRPEPLRGDGAMRPDGTPLPEAGRRAEGA